jgi:hypothetical protein
MRGVGQFLRRFYDSLSLVCCSRLRYLCCCHLSLRFVVCSVRSGLFVVEDRCARRFDSTGSTEVSVSYVAGRLPCRFVSRWWSCWLHGCCFGSLEVCCGAMLLQWSWRRGFLPSLPNYDWFSLAGRCCCCFRLSCRRRVVADAVESLAAEGWSSLRL